MKKRDLIIIISLILVDQLTKYLIFNTNINDFEIIKNFFYITKVYNQGAAWGLLSGFRLGFILISLIALYYMYTIYKKSLNNSFWLTISTNLLIGGTVGNLIDRIYLGKVRDFLNFYIFTFDYPVFNFADTFLVIGVFLIALFIIKNPESEIL